MGTASRSDVASAYAPPASGSLPDAVIFIPSLFGGGVPTADEAARRIAAALDRNARTRAAQFFIGEGRDESIVAGPGGAAAPTEPGRKATRVVSVMRREAEGGPAVPVVDVYDFQYRGSLIGTLVSRRPFVQALSVAGVLLANGGRVLRSVRAPSKDWSQKLQVAWGGVLFLGLVAYMLYLVTTAVLSVWGGQQQLAGESLPRWLSVMQQGAAILVALGLFTGTNLKEFVARVATATACAASYVSAGARQKTILGELARLLEHVAEREAAGRPYRRVHLVACSFGSVVGVDALFQDGRPPASFGRVDSLVTIGCPFDFLRTYFPEYFERRHPAPRDPGLPPLRWLNFYAPADVFGSDFMDAMPDGTLMPRGIGLAAGGPAIPESQVFGPSRGLKDYGVLPWLALAGFRVHANYWDADTDGLTCFDPIVRELLADTPALR